MAINDHHREDKKKSSESPDFSKDSMLEFNNKQNLKDLNSEGVTSKEETKNRGEDMEYKQKRSKNSSN